MPQFYVYVYRDPSRKNEPIYVGKGTGRRARRHLKRADMHPFTQRLQLMKREGVEPHIEIINCNNEEVAFAAEVLSIRVLGRKDLGKGSLLNLSDGGEGGPSGCIRSAETRQKMSDAKKGGNNHMYGKPAHNRGKSHTVETRKKQSDAKKGKVRPKAICPHCGKLSSPGRWHFDNCKYRK
jgi:hypothetical protein